MANTFQIVLTARDRASSVVNGVNSALSRVPPSLSRIGSAMERVGDTSILDRLQKGAVGLARPVVDAARSVGVLNNSLGLVFGAGSIAGAGALVANWGAVGVATGNAARGIGIAAGRLRTLRGAAELAGVGADEMTGSLGALATTLQDAAFGRNNEAAAMLNSLGIATRRTASGAVDAEAALGDLADAIAKQTNPQTQARIAGMFGVQALLPMLRKGRAGWTAYIKDIERLGAVSEETQRQSEELGTSINRLKGAASGVATTIESEWSRKFGRAIDGMTEWTAANKSTAASITEVAGALGVMAVAARIHPILGLVTGLVEGAALIYANWADIGGFFDRKLAEIDDAFRRSEWWQRQTGKDAVHDAYWWSFGLVGKGGLLWDTDKGSAAAATPAAPPASQLVPPAAPAAPGVMPVPGGVASPTSASIVSKAAANAVPSAGISQAVRRWDPQVNALSAKYGIDPNFVWRIMQQESGGRQFGKDGLPLTSSAGAIGPMQVMPGTFADMARRYGIKGGITDPDANIEAGVAYLSEQLKRFGNEPTAAAAYNAGPERVKDNIADGRPLPSETKKYIASIAAMERLQSQAPAGGEQKVNVTVTLGGNVPEGTAATAQTPSGNFVPTRIEYAMPSYARP